MALHENLIPITRPAAGDLSTKQYLFVEVNSSGQVSACNAAGEHSIGILQDKPDAAGKAANVAVGGVSKCVLGATVASGAKVTTDNAGRAVTAASTNHVHGTCLKGGAVNEIGEVLIQPQGILA